VIVAVVAVRVMKMAGNAIIHVVAVRNRLVAAAGAVHVSRLVTTAAVVGGAAVGVFARYLHHVLVDVVLVWVVEVAIMQIIYVPAVADGGMSAAGTMPVGMVGVGLGRASRHRFISFPCPKPRTPWRGSRPRGRRRCGPMAARARRQAHRRRALLGAAA
jgi:hypothetical protein